MDNIKNFIKREIGVGYCLVFATIFLILAKLLVPYFDGASWYIVSSIQRLLFGIVELSLFVKIFKKDKWTDVLHLKNFKHGLAASSAMFLMILFVIVTYFFIGAKSWIDTTVLTVVSCLFFQQITTGFWEELTFRAFVVEGYYQTENKTKRSRFVHAFISSVIFGMLHAVECDSISEALYRFVNTGISGFAFASVYLYSHNLLVVMLMHFVGNIFKCGANIFIAEFNISTAFIVLNDYIYFVLLGAMLLTAVIYLCREPKK